MKHPALALLWHCWRLSRRWYVVMLVITVGAHFTLLNLKPQGMGTGPHTRDLMTNVTVIFTMLLATFTTLIALSLGGRTGFPLRFEYRLPVRTTSLVAVPMAALAALCASLYAIPLLLSRIIYGLLMPVFAGSALIVALVALLVAASWSVSNVSMRSLAMVIAVIVGATLARSMQPFHMGEEGQPYGPFNSDVIEFSSVQYGLLGLVVLTLYAITVHGVGLQRQSESWGWALRRRTLERRGVSLNEMFLERASDLLRIPLPVKSAWQAELWLEFKRYGMPILAQSLLFALLMPALPALSKLLGIPAGVLAITGPVAVFFYGMGIAIFNRRAASAGYMQPFEGTRRLGTMQMAGIQLGMLGTAMALGLVLMGAGLWLSAPLFDDVGVLWRQAAALLSYASGATLAQQISITVVVLVAYFATITFYFCLHSCSVFWGSKALYGILVFLLYSGLFAHSHWPARAARHSSCRTCGGSPRPS
jgi:hypothetical protein